MKALNAKSTAKFFKLIEGLNEPGDSERISNNESFMPVVVEFNYQFDTGRQYSLSHYGEQNGDLMSDPDMTFFVDADGKVFPMTYRNDYAGVEQIAIELKDSVPKLLRKTAQADMVEFVQDWLVNIWEQQEMG